MAMIVKNNMSAINTLNTLNKNSTALSKSLQKVSSGMKINSAADDASGYAISERMRVQIRSLDQANSNTQNGSSMMKVAEGAVSSTVDILKTLKEKVINAANDTNTDTDRQTIQKELDQSIDQIDDNANVTFNGKYLVDGSKNTIGKATYTALSNQNLAANTTGGTLLTDLRSRSGDSLELSTTDKLTVSYVKGGKTYSATMSIAADTTLQDVFKAAEAANSADTVFATATNASVLKANGQTETDVTAAQAAATTAYTAAVTAAGTAHTHKDELDTATANNTAAVKALGTLNTADPSLSTGAVKTAYDAAVAWNATTEGAANPVDLTTIFKTDEKTTAAALTADVTAAGTKKDSTSDAAAALRAAATALQAASDKVNTASTGTKAVLATKTTAYTAADATAIADETAKKAVMESYTGPNLLTGANVGVAASDDMVTTADGTNAITITANDSGIGGQISGLNISVSDSQGNVKKSANASLDAWTETVRAQNKSDDNAIALQVGSKANQSIKVGLTDMRSEALGLKGADGTKLNISTQVKANAAVNVLDNALQKALDQQTTIGSVESRLEYTSSNLTTASSNVQASESTIRDADMAKEMTEYTKNNVLLQAAQSMLSQANQNSSSVLSLLK